MGFWNLFISSSDKGFLSFWNFVLSPAAMSWWVKKINRYEFTGIYLATVFGCCYGV
ncbi:hypothetical protein D3C86_1035930 [compost metagenome]